LEKLEEMSPKDLYSYEDFVFPKINEFDYTAYDNLCKSLGREETLPLSLQAMEEGQSDLSEHIN
jgi:hypothetical protein